MDKSVLWLRKSLFGGQIFLKNIRPQVGLVSVHIISLRMPSVAAVYCRISKMKKWTYIRMDEGKCGRGLVNIRPPYVDVIEQK